MTPEEIGDGCHESQERGSKDDVALSDDHALAQAWEARDAANKVLEIAIIRRSMRLSV